MRNVTFDHPLSQAEDAALLIMPGVISELGMRGRSGVTDDCSKVLITYGDHIYEASPEEAVRTYRAICRGLLEASSI